ncbi:MAG: hypothetical protein KBC91_07700 [Candidatus Omnitrophica bacterium]|nr:hypothetical protein [Candidatus Omnitrophota bacterium]
MKQNILMELLLLGSSILVFRSVWTFLDQMPWARGNAGLGGLLILGFIVAYYALAKIHNLEAASDVKVKAIQ